MRHADPQVDLSIRTGIVQSMHATGMTYLKVEDVTDYDVGVNGVEGFTFTFTPVPCIEMIHIPLAITNDQQRHQD